MKQQTVVQYLLIVAGILTLVGAVMHVFHSIFAPYIFTGGAILLVAGHAISAISVKSEDFRQRRLSRIGFIASLFLLVSSYLMFTQSNSWVVFLLIYAAITFYLSFRTE
ncbi:hypothetical protein LJB95_00600 [Paludibacteraceae bacterium OttesenSCG-928-F17]|nr:hypothetical protein [Paludibacteraceae bacterium OttesenSCG-928-F17]